MEDENSGQQRRNGGRGHQGSDLELSTSVCVCVCRVKYCVRLCVCIWDRVTCQDFSALTLTVTAKELVLGGQVGFLCVGLFQKKCKLCSIHELLVSVALEFHGPLYMKDGSVYRMMFP